MKIEWKTEYELNIKDIDDQHKILIELSNRVLKKAMNTPSDQPVEGIVELLQELEDYTSYHFIYEEELMQQYQYSKTIQHIEIHQSFIGKIESFKLEAQLNIKREFLLKMLSFLTDWIASHIMIEDKKYCNECQISNIF